MIFGKQAEWNARGKNSSHYVPLQRTTSYFNTMGTHLLKNFSIVKEEFTLKKIWRTPRKDLVI